MDVSQAILIESLTVPVLIGKKSIRYEALLYYGLTSHSLINECSRSNVQNDPKMVEKWLASIWAGY